MVSTTTDVSRSLDVVTKKVRLVVNNIYIYTLELKQILNSLSYTNISMLLILTVNKLSALLFVYYVINYTDLKLF